MKGRRVPILVAEQGIGRGAQPLTTFLNFFADRAGGDWSTTYAPKPMYITNKHRAMILENSEVNHGITARVDGFTNTNNSHCFTPNPCRFHFLIYATMTPS